MATSEERAAIDAYGRLRSELASLADRAADLEAEAAEHALVARTLEPMEPGRRAYRLVSEERVCLVGRRRAGVAAGRNDQPSPFPILSTTPQVGDVLVERTVGEVLPAVQSNKAQLDEVSE